MPEDEMGKLTVTFRDFTGAEMTVCVIDGVDILDTLTKLHEYLNAVGMPRIYHEQYQTTAEPHGQPTVVSC